MINLITGDCREELAKLPAESVHTCITSPPYFGLRDYGVEGQIGLEDTPEAFIETMVSVFCEVRRVLRKDGTVWLNLGDSYATTHHGKGGNSNSPAFNDPGGAWKENVVNNRRELGVPVGLKPKDLMMIPARVALALQADGWWLRSDIIWAKPNPMPESVTDRPTSAHEHVFLLAKSGRTVIWRHREGTWTTTEPAPDYRWAHVETGQEVENEQTSPAWRRINLWRGHNYYYDADAVREASIYGPGEGGHQRFGAPGGKAQAGYPDKLSGEIWNSNGSRNLRNVWTIATAPFPEAHFATFPPALVEPCIKAGCPEGGTVLDPFGGAGTTGLVADRLGRDAILIELNPDYADMARGRITQDGPLFAEVSGACQ